MINILSFLGDAQDITCPKDYGIAILTNIFGVTASNQCTIHDPYVDCVVTTDPTFYCREECTYFYPGNRLLPTCQNQVATYQYVEYQCIPTKSDLISPNTSCPADGSKMLVNVNRKGRFQNFNYPTLRNANCTYRLKTTPGKILNIYALDVSLNGYSKECRSNKITFMEDGDVDGTEFCEERLYTLLYSSCSNELDLRYVVTDLTQIYSFGIELYIETDVRPASWSCGKPLSTTTKSTIRTQPFTTFTARPLTTSDPNMFAYPEIENDVCLGKSFSYSCPAGYTFMIVDVYYGVKRLTSNNCAFTQGDCVQEAASTLTACANDAASCFISYSIARRLAHCSDRYADYLHITSQCVPSRAVGTGAVLNTYNICDGNDNIESFNGVITSPSFPSYAQTKNECKRSLPAIQDKVLKIWINEMYIASGGQRSLTGELYNV
jgi:hypothetical protein